MLSLRLFGVDSPGWSLVESRVSVSPTFTFSIGFTFHYSTFFFLSPNVHHQRSSNERTTHDTKIGSIVIVTVRTVFDAVFFFTVESAGGKKESEGNGVSRTRVQYLLLLKFDDGSCRVGGKEEGGE